LFGGVGIQSGSAPFKWFQMPTRFAINKEKRVSIQVKITDAAVRLPFSTVSQESHDI